MGHTGIIPKNRHVSGDLFDNPMVRAAKDSMTPEQLKYYQDIGESVFKDVDFETNEIITDPLSDAIVYIEMGLRSGLSPSDLSEDDVNVMVTQFGDDWYARYGYVFVNGEYTFTC